MATSATPGWPSSAFALGDEATESAGVLMLTGMLLGTVVGVWLASAEAHGAAAALRRALTTPMILAAVPALLWNVTDVEVPLLIDRSTRVLGAALVPIMLFTLGLQLVSSGTIRLARSTLIVLLAKLAAAPLAGFAAATALGLRGDDRAVVVIQSAMPPAVFCVLIALEYNLEPERTTNDMVVATLASFISLTAVLALLT